MAIANLLIKIGADISELQTNSEKSVRVIEKTSQQIESIGSTIQKSLIGAFTIGAAITVAETAISSLSRFVRGSIDSYANAEAAARKMTAALHAQGTETPAVINHFNALATQFQKTTVYSDDLINEMQALLTEVGNVAPHQMGKALTAATDLASGLGIDLRTATVLVGKAFAGHTETLGKYGIVLDASRVKGEGMAYVLDQIQARFGGQAQADAETYAGRIKQIGNEWDNFKEAVGKAFVTDPRIVSVLDALQERITGIGESTSRYQPTITDWWATLAGGSQAGLIVGYFNSIDQAIRDINHDIARLPAPPKAFTGFADEMTTKMLALDRESKAVVAATIDGWKKAAEAAKRHAEAIQAIADKYNGTAIAKKVSDLSEAMRKLPASADWKAVAEDVGKLFQEGAKLTPEMARLGVTFGTLTPKLITVDEAFKNVHETIDLVVPRVGDMWTELNKPIPFGITHLKETLSGFPFVATGVPKAEEFIVKVHDVDKALSALTQAFAQMAQIAGGSLGKTIQSLGTLVASLETANKSITAFSEGKKAFNAGDTLSGIAGMASGIMGIASAAFAAGKAIKDMFFGTAGRDAVKEFAATFQQFDLKTMAFKPGGGFDELHAKLLALGGDGEKLWIALTQGVGRNNPEQAAAVIKLIQDALSGQKTAIDATGAAATAAGDAQAAASQKARDAIQALDDEMSSLFKSIANEAPEEVMGIVESQTRERIAAIAAERDKAQSALDETAKAAAEGAEKAAQIIEDTLRSHDFRVKIHFDSDPIPGGGSLPGFAGGTHGRLLDFGAGTPVMLHGREGIVTEGEALGVDGGGHTTISAPDALRLFRGEVISLTRKDSARGGNRPRAAHGRSW